MENNRKSKRTIYLLLALLFLQFGGLTYFGFFKPDSKLEEVEKQSILIEKQKQVETTLNSLDSLTLEFEKIRTERSECGMDNATLNKQIEQLKKSNSLISGTVNVNEKYKFEQAISQMKKELDLNVPELEKLKMYNSTLEEKNVSLTALNQKLSDSLSLIQNSKKELENKIELASVLKAENFSISSVKKQLAIKFNISDNKVAKQGDKEFFIAISPKEGKVITDLSNQGGILTTADGASKEYTYKQNTNFTNNFQQIQFVIPKGIKYKRGEYLAQIYCEGFVIGEFSFLVK